MNTIKLTGNFVFISGVPATGRNIVFKLRNNFPFGPAGVLVENPPIIVTLGENGEIPDDTFLPVPDAFNQFYSYDVLLPDGRKQSIVLSRNDGTEADIYYILQRTGTGYAMSVLNTNAFFTAPTFLDFVLNVPANQSLILFGELEIVEGGEILLNYNSSVMVIG